MSNHANTAGRLLVGAIALIHGAFSEAQAPPPATGEVITRYLQQDIFIRPGVGFRSVQLGHSFVQVAQTWGEPVGMRRTGFFRSNRIWGYQIGPNTEVLLSGPSRVTTIEVRGTMASTFQSTEGARFGMTPQQIRSIYGRPDSSEGHRFTYSRRGVEFDFESGVLRKIRVVQARR